jgi:hypothetical protein
MADQFPKMVPTTRSFTMGDYPSTTYRSLSGVIFKRNFGNKQTGYRLDMTFRNIGDANEFKENSGAAKQILNHYEDVKGTFESFTLPEMIFSGMDDVLRGKIQEPADISWRYAAPPQVQSVKANVSTVTVRLIGELSV